MLRETLLPIYLAISYIPILFIKICDYLLYIITKHMAGTDRYIEIRNSCSVLQTLNKWGYVAL